jgi:hypothetical protein
VSWSSGGFGRRTSRGHFRIRQQHTTLFFGIDVCAPRNINVILTLILMAILLDSYLDLTQFPICEVYNVSRTCITTDQLLSALPIAAGRVEAACGNRFKASMAPLLGSRCSRGGSLPSKMIASINFFHVSGQLVRQEFSDASPPVPHSSNNKTSL